MKILVIDIAARGGGALSIIEDFYKQTKKDKKNQYFFLLSQNLIDDSPKDDIIIVKKQNWINRMYFDYFGAKKYIKKIKPDIILSFQNTMVKCKNVKKILYVHQAIPFQEIKKFSFFKKSEFKLAIRQYFLGYFIKKSIKKVDHVIVQTKWLKKAIVKICDINEKKVSIIHPKINLSTQGRPNDKKFSYNKFFYPTSNVIYKNNEIIYKAIEALKAKKVDNFNVELTINSIDKNNLKFLGKIPREDVLEKYENTVMVFPSYIESFGMPLLEARMVGTIIFASNTSFSREILDCYPNAFFFNPFDYNELANLMEQSISGKIKIRDDENKIFYNKNSIIEVINNMN